MLEEIHLIFPLPPRTVGVFVLPFFILQYVDESFGFTYVMNEIVYFPLYPCAFI